MSGYARGHRKRKRLEDRIGKTIAARRLEMLKRFTRYCLKMRWIPIDPADELDSITPDDHVTLPLTGGRYEAVIAATYRYDEEMRPDDRFGAELRAIIGLMRWSGLRHRVCTAPLLGVAVLFGICSCRNETHSRTE